MHKKKENKLYKTAKLQRRTISQIIRASGKLEARGTIRVGSLVNGIVEKMYVRANQTVKKGQLLAKIDNGKEDSAVKQAEGFLELAQAELKYQTASYKRQQQLYQSGHISLDEFQQAQRTHIRSRASVKSQKAIHQRAAIEFDNTKITSPINGIIIEKNVSVREGVSGISPPTVIYTIAEDTRTMDVELEIDETNIGPLKLNQVANLQFDAYPHKKFYGKISDISNAPVIKGSMVTYKAVISIDNRKLLLKPGFTVHAQIIIAEKKNVLSVPNYFFSINKKALRVVAAKKGYGFHRLSPKNKAQFKKTMRNQDNPIRQLWIFKDNAFVEKAVEIGVTDHAFFEIVSGVDDSQDVIVDVNEPDDMGKLYKQFLGGGL